MRIRLFIGILYFFACSCLAQHPTSFRYNLEKKQYSISASEKKEVTKHIEEWFAAHDSIGKLIKINLIIFSPDYKTLPVCDSIGSQMTYEKKKFNGFPGDNNGSFYGAGIILQNKEGINEQYNIDVSYSYQVVRIWFQERVLYKLKA